MLLRRTRIALAGLIALLACAAPAGAQDPDAPGTGPGGPVLVLADPGDAFGRYDAEILRAEGLNAFAVDDAGGAIDAATLAGHRVVVLAQRALGDADVAALTAWVQAGGNLIAMRPDPKLAPLLGLAGSGTGTVEQGYLDVDGSSAPGKGITDVPMQFHGVADRWIVNGARTVATLQDANGAETGSPAVTLRSVGTQGGQAAAFTYDLAASVVLTRQGNPDLEGVEGDGQPSGLRSGDLFAGGWLDFDKVRIPQADEQQRLLANLVTQMSLDALPMPRFWYLPRGEKAAVVMTGDDHAQGGTIGQFGRFVADSPQNCSVADWECVRATSYLYTGSSIQPDTAKAWRDQGFELSLHLNTENCTTYTDAQLAARVADQVGTLRANVGSFLPVASMRAHCAAWPTWAGMAKAEVAQGIRLDTDYYWWPAAWALTRPGMFTGSGFPMRFADTDGTIIDVYQATTQLTDELDPTFAHVRPHIEALLDGALGDDGYYGAFTTNMHTDQPTHAGADAIVAEAQERDVPVISAEQLLRWTDGRNESTFTGLSYAGGVLRFGLERADGANGLEAMVPAAGITGALQSLTRDGQAVAVTPRTVKGIEYAVFSAAPGAYVATYPSAGGPGQPPPTGPSGNPPAPDATKPYLTLRKRFARANRKGRVVFVATCPASETRCAVDFRIVRKGKRLARTRLTLAGGKTAKVRLKLSRAARRKLARKSPLVARAVIRITDASGNTATQRTPVTLYGPRKR